MVFLVGDEDRDFYFLVVILISKSEMISVSFLLFISLLVQRNGTKERTLNTRNFSIYNGKPIPKLRVEQVLLSTGAFVHLFCVLGVMES